MNPQSLEAVSDGQSTAGTAVQRLGSAEKRRQATVVIVNWNTKDLLHQCLSSLTPGMHEWFDVIVVDNASSDESVAMCRTLHPAVRVISSGRNLGYGGGNNLGVGTCQSDAVLLLNSDTVLEAATIRTMLTTMASDERIGLIGCRLRGAAGEPQLSCMRFPSVTLIAIQELLLYRVSHRLPRMFVEPPLLLKATECDWVYGTALLVRRAAFLEVGGFDTAFWMYGEEMDLCYRLRRAGWRIVFDPTAEIVHLGEGSWASGSPLPRYLRSRALVRYARKHEPKWKATLAAALVGGGSGLRLMWGSAGLLSRRIAGRDAEREVSEIKAQWWVLKVLLGLGEPRHGPTQDT